MIATRHAPSWPSPALLAEQAVAPGFPSRARGSQDHSVNLGIWTSSLDPASLQLLPTTEMLGIPILHEIYKGSPK